MCSQLSHGPPHDHRRCECIQSRTLFPTASVYCTRSRNRCVRLTTIHSFHPNNVVALARVQVVLFCLSLACSRGFTPRPHGPSLHTGRHVPFRPHPAAACMTSMCVLVEPTPRRPKLPGDRQWFSRSECMGDQMMSYLAFKLFILTNILVLTSLYIYTLHIYILFEYNCTYYPSGVRVRNCHIF